MTRPYGGVLPTGHITEETLDLMKGAFAVGPQQGPGLRKQGIGIAEGLEGINLEAPSKKLYPVYSPLRNRIPRIGAPVGASAVQWRQIDEINSAKLRPGVAENLRNSFNTTATSNRTASFKTLGHDDFVGFEALSRSKGFEDVRATAALNLLYSVMISEELMLLGGNVTDLGAPAGSVATPVASGGGIADGTYRVAVSALTLFGNELLNVATKGKAAGAAEADGETVPALDAGVVVSGGGGSGSITYAWTALKGAVAYNVFISPAGGGLGTEEYQTTVFVNRHIFIVAPGGGANPNSVDNSGSALDHDGIIPLIETKATGTLFKSLDDVALTSDGSGGITEFDDLLKEMWDTYRLGPTEILVNSQQAKDITNKIGGSSNLAYRIYLQDGQRNVVGGIYVGAYLNKFASSFAEGFPNEVPIRIHPNLPQSTILFVVHTLPYPNNQIPNVWEVETLQEYTQYEWALTARRYEFGIYHQQVLKDYFAKAQGALVCVKSG